MLFTSNVWSFNGHLYATGSRIRDKTVASWLMCHETGIKVSKLGIYFTHW